MNNQIKIAFTGHRHLGYAQVESLFNKIHAEFPDSVWITGGAVGLDSCAALFAMAHQIPLWLIAPFPPAIMTKKWSAAQSDDLMRSIKYCEKFSVLSNTYAAAVYQRRNERMVDLADVVVAFWDGSPGGTGNCHRYATSTGKKIIRFSSF